MKPIKTGLASYGLSGQVFHAPFLAVNPAFELTACVERSKNLINDRYPWVHTVRSFDELLSIAEIELVVVNTPDVTHYDYVKSALLAGKNVVVEKPFVSTVEQAVELTTLAREKGLLLTTYQNRRFDGDFCTVRKLIEKGELGRIIEYNTAAERFRDVDPAKWREKADGNVGLLYDLGAHSLDQILLLFGMPQSLWCTTDVVRDGGQVCDYFEVVMIYSRMRANIRGSKRIREAGANFAVHGTDGSYVVHSIDPQEERLKGGAIPGGEHWGEVRPEDWGILNNNEGRRNYPTANGDYGQYYHNIYECLRNGAQPEVTHYQMIDLMRLLTACMESAKTGSLVKFDS